MSCDCPTPSSSPFPYCSPYADNLNCSQQGATNVKMYLGEKYSNITLSLKVFSTENEDFVTEYSAKELFDAQVLDINGPWPDNEDVWYTFNLTEQELLASANYETWIAFAQAQLVCGNNQTFCSLVLKNLGLDFDSLSPQVAIIFNSYIKAITNQEQINSDNLQGLVTNISELFAEATVEKQEKIKLCFDWFKNIYDSYYGKKFLIRIGESSNSTNAPFHGICVKQLSDNQTPDRDFPYFIDGDGSSQGYYLSDVISTEGGWPNRNVTDIIGLPLYSEELKHFLTEDGKVESFVRFGDVFANNDYTVYRKFGREFVVDFSRLNPDAYTLYTNTGGTQTLYIKANVSNRIYFDNDGQWALVTLNDVVPLIQKYPDNEWARSSAANCFLNFLAPTNSDIYKALQVVLSHSTGIQNGGSAFYNLGARNAITLFNTFDGNNISFFPKGAVIPLKSNIYSYGPYYYDASSPIDGQGGGGVEVERNESLVPWNFIPPDNTGYIDVNQAYTNMDCVGSALAKDGAKGLQKLEKGTITVVGLPEYSIGYSVDNNNGPTILTDIAVEYGSNGFRTSYNFSTYSPRLGRPAKYILESWQDNIKQVNYTNNYLREDRARLHSLNNSLKRNILDAQIKAGFNPIRSRDVNSPAKLLISGYYLAVPLAGSGNIVPYSDSRDGTIDISVVQSVNKPCDSCSTPPSPSPSQSCFDIPEPPAEEAQHRLYTFAETHEAYQEDYIQSSYNQLCIMSLDGLFSPVSLAGDNEMQHTRIPRFAMRLDESGSFVEWHESSISSYKTQPGYHPLTKSRDEMPPFKVCGSSHAYTLPIHQQYLNPITSGKALEDWDDRKNDSTKGFVISSIAFGNQFTDYQLGFSSENEIARQDETNFRFSALRGPLVIHGWGYDTAGKPIPNSNDIPKQAEKGKFRRDKLTDKFMDEWLQNPRTWPIGPVDLRFDRERGVWTCPSPNKIIVARLLEPLKPLSSARAELINPVADGIKFYEDHHISGPNGEDIRSDISKTEITVYDFLGIEKSLCKCDTIYAYWDSNRYIVLENSRSYKQLPECDPCTTTTTVGPTVTTPTPCPSPSFSVTPSPSIEPCPSPSFSVEISASPSVSIGVSVSPSASVGVSASPSVSVEISPSQSPSIEPSQSPSLEPSVSVEVSASPYASPQPSPSVCWAGLEVLKSVKNYNQCKTQALIHRDGCLEWEDIVECDPIKNFEEKQKQQQCEQSQQ